MSQEEKEKLLSRLEAMNYRGEITGPEGSGKTTLLEDTGHLLKKKGFTVKSLFLNREKRNLEKTFMKDFYEGLSCRDIILFDGAEQLSWLAWQSFKRKTFPAGGLVIASLKAGLLPALHRCSTGPELFQEIVEDLTGEEGRRTKELNKKIYLKNKGNIRCALRELYDIYSS